MNVLVLFGSPHTGGSTAKLTGAFMKGLRKSDNVKVIRLYELMPTPCNACGYCKAANGCSKKDLDPFMKVFEEADILVIATPIYNLSFPAPLKALFDRFQRYYEARVRRKIREPVAKPKKAILIAAAGSDGEGGFEIIKRQCAASFSFLNTKLAGSMLCNHTDDCGVDKTDLHRAFELAKSVE